MNAATTTAAAPAAPAAATTVAASAPTTPAAETPAAAPATDAAPAADGSLLDGAPPTEQTADPADKPVDEAAPPARSAPDKYEFKLPEGVTADSEVIGEFEGVARELGMPQAEADTILTRMLPKIAERQKAAFETTVSGWSTAARDEFGKDGKLAETIAVGERALTQFGDPELRALLKESRIGNHPAVIRMLVKAGNAISEDTLVSGRPAGQAKTAAQILYPTMT